MSLSANQCSACIEMLYAKDAENFADRIAMAAQDGFAAIEFWGTSNKDIEAIEDAVKKVNIKVQGFLCDPTLALADPANHAAFLQNVARAVELGEKFDAGGIIVILGPIVEELSPETQRANIIEVLKKACNIVDKASVKLALEPINQTEQPKGYLHDTTDALDIIDAVGDPRLGMLYDMYHAGKQGEDMRTVLAGRVDRLVHVHLADLPDRHEPNTGTMSWQDDVTWLKENGFKGLIGLEYLPTKTTREGLGFLS